MRATFVVTPTRKPSFLAESPCFDSIQILSVGCPFRAMSVISVVLEPMSHA